MRGVRGVFLVAAAALLLAVPLALAFDQQTEERNYSKTRERWEHESSKPEFRAMVRDQSAENGAE